MRSPQIGITAQNSVSENSASEDGLSLLEECEPQKKKVSFQTALAAAAGSI